MSVDWQVVGTWVAVGTAVMAVVAVIVAIFTLRKMSRQTELLRGQTDLLRRQVFGQVYEEARINCLEFYLPEKQKHAVDGFEQKEDSEITLGNSISIPVGCERELHVRWWMAESQTLRSFSIGFLDRDGGKDYGFQNKPRIIERVTPFVKREYAFLAREEYIDWHGNYYCEFGHARRLPKGECFVCAVRVKGEKTGEYVLAVEISVAEAPHAFTGKLTLKCE